jgi:hypothetical protein
VIDPGNVLGPLTEALEMHAQNLEEFFGEPTDPIELPPEISPTTRDNRVIHVDPFPGPESPPNPVRQRPQFYEASAKLPNVVGNEPGESLPDAYPRISRPVLSPDLADNNPPNRRATPTQVTSLPGIYSGKPMRRWVVPPPIWGVR